MDLFPSLRFYLFLSFLFFFLFLNGARGNKPDACRAARIKMKRVSICGRVVKALRSGRSQLCWRGFESHRMYTFFFFLIFLKEEEEEKKSWRYRDSSPGQADHNRLC